MKKIAIIPTLCTLGNACCGFTSIVFAARINIASQTEADMAIYLSGLLIFVAMVFDAIDGYLARLSKTASQFGAELDSLCDAISFGAAPGFLLLRLGSSGTPFENNRLMWDVFLFAAMIYMVCAIMRLTRFNVQSTLDPKSHRSFRGLPSPAAAGCIASLAMLRYDVPLRWQGWVAPEEFVNPLVHWVAPLGAVVVAWLMVSPVRYPHLVNQLLHRRRQFSRVVEMVLAFFAMALMQEIALVLVFWAYALFGPARLLWYRAVRHQPAPTGEPAEPAAANRPASISERPT